MNYKEIVEVIKEIVEAHYFINTWGYGEISDIMTPENQEPPNYPYMFLNPVSIGGGDRSDSFTFNLICMTQAYDTEVDTIEEQSNCLVYLKDVISRVNMTLDHPLIQFIEPYTFTPFKERFQDDVVGFTATMTIQYSNSLDICNAPITNLPPTPAFPNCPQVLVIDGDDTQHYLDAGDSYTCLPATPKSGIFYQRVVPWDNNLTDTPPDYSVDWHKTQGTYNYTPPTNPEKISLLGNGYAGTDERCLLATPNEFGNLYRYTNDKGEQYVENFNNSPLNTSENRQYCIDHLTGLAFFVDDGYVFENYTWLQALDNAHSFSYAGYSDWRLADVNEFLTNFNFNDWNNAWPTAYTPWMDPDVRNYGARYWFGSRDRDGAFQFTQTNGATIGATLSPTVTCHSSLKVRNHYT